MPNLLVLDNVSKVYNNQYAVEKVSLAIPEGSIFGLLGPNGAGKTTLIRMITNILYQDSGTISLGHIAANQRNMYIGYMPEERGLYKKMKVGEHLLYLAELKNLSRAEARQRIDYWLQKFEITDWWNKKVEELSKGMQQKIQFIATIVHQPKLLILDEPFSGLDPINANLLQDEIFALKQQGTTILFSTHRMEQVEQICDYIALINQGKVILQGEVKPLRQQFKKNLFSVDYQLIDNQAIPHLADNDIFEIAEHQVEKQQLTLRLRPPHTTNDMLQLLLQKGIILHGFQEILPSLNEIFITQVQYFNQTHGTRQTITAG